MNEPTKAIQYLIDTAPLYAKSKADAFERFAVLVAQHERKRIAQKIEQLPFGDTAASFGVYVREA
jgi:hypothetical protein